MKIRSITYFCNPEYPLNEQVLQQAGTFLAEAKSAYEAAGYEVQCKFPFKPFEYFMCKM